MEHGAAIVEDDRRKEPTTHREQRVYPRLASRLATGEGHDLPLVEHGFGHCFTKERWDCFSNLLHDLRPRPTEHEVVVESLQPCSFPWRKRTILTGVNAAVGSGVDEINGDCGGRLVCIESGV